LSLETYDEILHGKNYPECSIFDIKSFKKNDDSFLYTIGIDYFVKAWKVSNDEIV